MSGARHSIFRASWAYRPRSDNLLKAMLRLSRSLSELQVINDQWGVSTHMNYLAAVTLDLINLAILGFGSPHQGLSKRGTYHYASISETTWFEYARPVINTAKSAGTSQICKTIILVRTAEYSSETARPLNS